MGRYLILACSLLILIPLQADAQTAAPPAEATQLYNKCEELFNEGKYDEAMEPCQRALALVEKAIGSNHINVVPFLTSLADLYWAIGDYARTESLEQRALVIYEKAGGPEHIAVGYMLDRLASFYTGNGEAAKARPLIERAIVIYEKAVRGEYHDDPELLNNLASLYADKGDYAKAEPLYQRSLAIMEKEFGRSHLFVGIALGNLAGLYKDQGDYEKAEQFYKRALAIMERTFEARSLFGKDVLVDLAIFFTEKGDFTQAVELQSRAEEILEGNVNAFVSIGSVRQRQLYLENRAKITRITVSLHAYSAPTNVKAAQLALTTILRRKGRLLDAMTDQIANLRRRSAPSDIMLLDALAEAQSQLATLQLSTDRRRPSVKRQITRLETRIEKLQADLGRRNAEFRASTQRVTLNAVRRAMPVDAALIELFTYQPYNVKANSNSEGSDKMRYIAYVLKPQSDTPQFVDLGEAAQIDDDLMLWREALLNPNRSDVRELGRKVDERVMRPIRKLLGDTKRLFISPDGALNLIPFAALIDENNQYLIETYSLNYLTSGRDLLRLQVRSDNRSGAVIFANPTYNLTNQPVAACQRPRPGRGLSLATAATNDRPPATTRDMEYRGIDFTQVCYPPLKGTSEEAALISRTLPNVTVLTDKQATEAALKKLNSPAILHIATHGFFLPDRQQNLNNDIGLNSPPAPIQNPLLRSGLIMAGANQKLSGTGEDGVLTAAEAAGLNLWGTKLVVLSACETGLGDVVNGDGVYGLRRALVLAGSETQVMSLWQVDDAATRDLMNEYYMRLQRGEGRTEAIRQAQLSMLRGETQRRSSREIPVGQTAVPNSRHAHPYFWAAFISSGDWRSMNGKEQ